MTERTLSTPTVPRARTVMSVTLSRPASGLETDAAHRCLPLGPARSPRTLHQIGRSRPAQKGHSGHVPPRA